MAEALRQQYVDMNAPLLAPENLLPDAYASTSKGGKKVPLLVQIATGKLVDPPPRWPDGFCSAEGCVLNLADVLLCHSSVLFIPY